MSFKDSLSNRTVRLKTYPGLTYADLVKAVGDDLALTGAPGPLKTVGTILQDIIKIGWKGWV